MVSNTDSVPMTETTIVRTNRIIIVVFDMSISFFINITLFYQTDNLSAGIYLHAIYNIMRNIIYLFYSFLYYADI